MKHIIHRAAIAVAFCTFFLSALAALDAPIADAAPRSPKPHVVQKKQTPAFEGVVNINTADAGQLRMLPGVGATKAERIVQFRAKRGKFVRIKDLRRVKGFGKKTVDKLEPYLSIKGPTTLAKKRP